MVCNAVKIEKTIHEVLDSTEANPVEKLHSLNINSYLNGYLTKSNFSTITEVVVNEIEEGSTSEVNVDVLKFYLHELALIFNLNTYNNYFEGVVYIG